MCTLTDQFNAHIYKKSSSIGIKIHWWGEPEKQKYHSKIDFVKEHYSSLKCRFKFQIREINLKLAGVI